MQEGEGHDILGQGQGEGEQISAHIAGMGHLISEPKFKIPTPPTTQIWPVDSCIFYRATCR